VGVAYMNKVKLKQLLQSSKKVFADVSLPNGAIVAANTDQKYYPRSAKDYYYVWPRDAAYVCIALDYLDNENKGKSGDGFCIQKSYFKWLEERPEDFKKEGLILQNYSTNGRKYKHQFQPDQTGISLWAIWHHFENNLSDSVEFETLVRRLADGICNDWKGSYFFTNTCDLWEEGRRKTSTKVENNFTYSLAACASGLEKAFLMFPNNEQWAQTANEMRKKIDEAYSVEDKYFLRNHGKIEDINTDASLLGLVWPFNIIDAKDARMINTVKRMEEKIIINGGVHRFEMDYYDGEGTSAEGGGAWPMLNFWMAIYWHLAGNQKKADSYFDWVLKKVDNEFIPEQIYGDFRDGKGVSPLAWSHAMFVISYFMLVNQLLRVTQFN